MIKRLLDITISSLLLLILTPVFVVIGLFVAWKLGRPVFFSQTRPGLHEKPFKMIKFRTMTNETDKQGILLPNENRLTKLGSFLRSYSLDELPELFNVLKGDMSLVGPRPLLMEYLPYFSDKHRKRHNVKPGITGWAQVNGRNAIDWHKKFDLDLWYVKNQSFWLDMKILWLTFFKVFKREGITYQGHATMPRFDEEKKTRMETTPGNQ